MATSDRNSYFVHEKYEKFTMVRALNFRDLRALTIVNFSYFVHEKYEKFTMVRALKSRKFPEDRYF